MPHADRSQTGVAPGLTGSQDRPGHPPPECRMNRIPSCIAAGLLAMAALLPAVTPCAGR
ncbi:hypothetical protein [Roseateles cavernae]|uniref:hypothetical protein n=1 Tax=Roseateles cavernae TaxID=3153578 RepID=UPI0032E3F756